MDVRTTLVLGSNSFTGSHFIEYALNHTKAKVIGISRSEEYNPILLPYLYKKKSRPQRFTFHQLSVVKDMDKILKIIDEHKPEVVVNYSAQGEVRNSWNWPEQWFATNCMATVTLANALAQKPFLKRYVSVSTPEVYGSTKQGLKECNEYSPSTPYAASKLAGDLFLGALHKRYGFPVVYTRSANLYGIHQQLYRIIPRTIIYLRLGKKIQLHGEGKTRRSFIHARDVADATWKAIVSGTSGEVYHLAPEKEEVTIYDLVKTICEMMHKDFHANVELLKENFGQDALFSLDASKARQELGWRPSVSLKDGIQETIKWVDDNWETIKSLPLDYVHKP